MEALDTQVQIEKFLKLIDDTRHECISRSGMVDVDHTGGDGSNFSVIFLAAFTEAASNLSGKGLFSNEFKEEVVNRFMIYQHEMIVRRQHFNWNWD